MDLAIFLCLVALFIIAADIITIDNEFQHKLDKLEE